MNVTTARELRRKALAPRLVPFLERIEAAAKQGKSEIGGISIPNDLASELRSLGFEVHPNNGMQNATSIGWYG